MTDPSHGSAVPYAAFVTQPCETESAMPAMLPSVPPSCGALYTG